jgi:hypothetical protein
LPDCGTAWNLKKMMQKLKEEFLRIICRLFFPEDFCSVAAWRLERRT